MDPVFGSDFSKVSDAWHLTAVVIFTLICWWLGQADVWCLGPPFWGYVCHGPSLGRFVHSTVEV